jgi:hypothetical protein
MASFVHQGPRHIYFVFAPQRLAGIPLHVPSVCPGLFEDGNHVLVHVAAVSSRFAKCRYVAARDSDLLAGRPIINAAFACGLRSARGTGSTCRRLRHGRRFGQVNPERTAGWPSCLSRRGVARCARLDIYATVGTEQTSA